MAGDLAPGGAAAAAHSRLSVLARHVEAPALLRPLACLPTAAAPGGLVNRRVTLARAPAGDPQPSDFATLAEPLPPIKDGEMLLRTKWLSLDPYMRTGEGMTSPRALGRTMVGGTVSEVLESRAVGWSPGDLVVGYYGWQEFAVARPTDVQWNIKRWPIEKWDPALGEASHALGTLGMTGYTAYFGLLEVAKPRAGDTAVISAAGGAVGAVAGQLAKARGCRVVGVAGGPAKCAYCVEELGFDVCVDYKAPGFPEALAAAAPGGVDIYFENVGGDVLEAVIPLLNRGCRVPVCGYVSQYNSPDTRTSREHPKTPLQRLKEVGLPVMGKRGATDGFAFFHFDQFLDRFPEAQRDLSALIRDGKIKVRESISHGLDASVDAFRGMLRGENFGKTLVKLA